MPTYEYCLQFKNTSDWKTFSVAYDKGKVDEWISLIKNSQGKLSYRIIRRELVQVKEEVLYPVG